MGLIRSMEHLKVHNKNDTFQDIEKSSNKSDWENWDRLKISAFHGKKLIRRNFQPYCSAKGERFFLHEIDNFGFDAERKVYILVQTFRRLFGTNLDKHSDTAKWRKHATKITFLREKGKRYFREGKLITDLIDFPQSYWEALEALKVARAEKHAKRSSSSKEKIDTNKEEDELLADETPPKKRLRSDSVSSKNNKT